MLEATKESSVKKSIVLIPPAQVMVSVLKMAFVFAKRAGLVRKRRKFPINLINSILQQQFRPRL